MFIHIGGDIVVRAIDVVAILDINHMKRDSKKSNYYESRVKNEQEVVKITDKDVKSIIITNKKLYYSPISSLTLKKRANLLYN